MGQRVAILLSMLVYGHIFFFNVIWRRLLKILRDRPEGEKILIRQLSSVWQNNGKKFKEESGCKAFSATNTDRCQLTRRKHGVSYGPQISSFPNIFQTCKPVLSIYSYYTSLHPRSSQKLDNSMSWKLSSAVRCLLRKLPTCAYSHRQKSTRLCQASPLTPLAS